MGGLILAFLVGVCTPLASIFIWCAICEIKWLKRTGQEKEKRK